METTIGLWVVTMLLTLFVFFISGMKIKGGGIGDQIINLFVMGGIVIAVLVVWLIYFIIV